MPIVFHDEVNKSKYGRGEARKFLLSFLDKNQPQLIRWLYRLWDNQEKSITYKQLREWIMAGFIDPELLDEWQQDYVRFVIQFVKPMYSQAMDEASKQLSRRFPLFSFDPMTEGVKRWTDTMSAAFVTKSTAEQISAVRWVVARASQMKDMGVDELARVIRPMVGLNKPQTIANMNYYNKLRENGLSERKAKEMSIKYGAKQHRYRAHMISRTEMAYAYNKGEHIGVEQAIEQGYMGRVVKVWEDAGDDRVCKICKGLHERTHKQGVDMDSGFGFPTRLKQSFPDIDLTPPAHPHCRCVCTYVEVEAPDFTTIDW
jgi:hypothetical protein